MSEPSIPPLSSNAWPLDRKDVSNCRPLIGFVALVLGALGCCLSKGTKGRDI